jgi:hypothetical protein
MADFDGERHPTCPAAFAQAHGDDAGSITDLEIADLQGQRFTDPEAGAGQQFNQGDIAHAAAGVDRAQEPPQIPVVEGLGGMRRQPQAGYRLGGVLAELPRAHPQAKKRDSATTR